MFGLSAADRAPPRADDNAMRTVNRDFMVVKLLQKIRRHWARRSAAADMRESSAASFSASYVTLKRRKAPASSQGTVTMDCCVMRYWLAASAVSNLVPSARP